MNENAVFLTEADLHAAIAQCQSDFQAHRAEALRLKEQSDNHLAEATRQDGLYAGLQKLLLIARSRPKEAVGEKV